MRGERSALAGRRGSGGARGWLVRALACAAALTGCGEEPPPAGEGLALRSRADSRPADFAHEARPEVLEGADEERWIAEEFANELAAGALQELRFVLLGERIPDLPTLFTEDARLAPPWPNAWEEESVGEGIVLRRWALDPDRSRHLGPDGWLAAVQELLGRSHRARWALLKPAHVVRRDDGPGSVEVELKWYLNRELPGGGLQQDSGRWHSEWIRGEDRRWRCRLLQPLRDNTSLVSAAPHFVDRTEVALRDTGVDPRLPTRRTAFQRGVAMEDLDADGDLDVVVSIPVRFLYNRGDGTFVERTKEVLPVSNDPLWQGRRFAGVLVADFDRDGAKDVVLAARRDECLLLLQREGEFVHRSIPQTHRTNIPTSLSAQDVDGDGWLDLFVSGYGLIEEEGPNSVDDATNGERNQILRGLSGGRFEDVTEAWGLDVGATRWTFIGAFGDPDDDGDQDLYLANDFGPNVLYRNRLVPSGEVGFDAEVEDAEVVDAGFSMSATWADLDDDLDLDLYVSNMSSTAATRIRAQTGAGESDIDRRLDDIRRRMSKGNSMLRNEGGLLVESSFARGARAANWAWGTAVFDYDADGDLDIHCLNGFWSYGEDDGRDL